MQKEKSCCKIIMLLFKVIILLVLATRIECSDARPQTPDDFHKYYKSYYPSHGLESYDSLLSDLAKFKRKLQIQDRVRVDDAGNQKQEGSIEASHQNPVDLLRMIPQIILYFRTNSATHKEHQLMQSIFGKLWHSIEAEINRGDPMDPLLRGILNSIRKSDSIKGRPIKSNSVLVRRRRTLVSCVNHANISPADNLMNCVWSIVTRHSATPNMARLNRRSVSSTNQPQPLVITKKGGSGGNKKLARRKRSLVVDRSSDVEVLKSFITMINEHNSSGLSDSVDYDDDDSQESRRPSIYELFKLANMHKMKKLANM